jgi:hypothetical protein
MMANVTRPHFKDFGYTIKMYTIDDVSDGNFHVAIVTVDLRSESASIEFSRLQK